MERPSTINIQPSKVNFKFQSVFEKDIFKELKNLKRKKSGLDNFPPGMLKDAAGILIKPLTYIINLSLGTGLYLLIGKRPR